MKRVPGVPVKTSVKPKALAAAHGQKPAPSAAGGSAATSTKPTSAVPAVPGPRSASGTAGAAGVIASAGQAVPPGAAKSAAGGHGSAASALADVGKHNLPADREKGLAEMREAVQKQLRAAAEARKAAEGEAGRWLDIKVFVSSTFKDMHAERDQLNKVVFPRLNVEFGQSMQVRFVQVDLRWGLTAEDTSVTGRGAVLCCLDEIERCRPFFLCLLGNRYGWVPEGSYLPISLPPEDLEKYAWLRRWPLGDSVTELEIVYGALGALSAQEADQLAARQAAPQERPQGGGQEPELPRAFAFHRDDSFLAAVKDAAGRAVYGAADEPTDPRQRALCERVRASPLFQNFTYTCRYQKQGATLAGLAAFGHAVFGCLSAAATAMREKRGGGRQEHWTLPISLKQSAYAEARAASCVGRAEAVARIVAFAAGRDGGGAPVLALVGEPGSGRSTVLARACVELARAASPLVAFFEHAAWAPADSSAFERWLNAALERLVPDKDRHSIGFFAKASEFAKLLPEGTFVCLDAPPDRTAAALAQLGPAAGGRLRAAFSCASREEAAKASPAAAVFELPPLDAGQAGELVRHMLAEAGKKLTDAQLAALVAKEGTRSPLYLEIAVSELLLFGVFEKLDAEIKALAPTLGALVQQCAARMERDFGAALVQSALGLLCQDAVHLGFSGGLCEADLLVALAVAAPGLEKAPGAAGGGLRPVSRALWSQVHNSIPHLLRPREGLEREPIRFRSLHVARALATRYLLNCVHGGDCFCEFNGLDLEEEDEPSAKKVAAWGDKWAEKEGRLYQARAVMRLVLPGRHAVELRDLLSRTAYWETLPEPPPGPQAALVKTFLDGMAQARQLASFRAEGWLFGTRDALDLRSTLAILRGLARVPALRKVDLRRMDVATHQVLRGRLFEDSSPKKTLRECYAAVTAFVSAAPALAVLSAPPLLIADVEGGGAKKKAAKKKAKDGDDGPKDKKKAAARELSELREEFLAALARKRTLTGLSLACPPPLLGPLVKSMASLRFLHLHGGSAAHRHLLLFETLERLTAALGGLGPHPALRAVYVALPDADLSDRGIAALVAAFRGAPASCELWHLRSMAVDIPEGKWTLRQVKEEAGRIRSWELDIDYGDIDHRRIRALEIADRLVPAGRTALPPAPTLEQLARGAFAPGSPSRAVRVVLGALHHVMCTPPSWAAGPWSAAPPALVEPHLQPPATIRDILGSGLGEDQAPDSAPWPLESPFYEDCPLVGLWAGEGGCTLRVQVSYCDGQHDRPTLVLELRDPELGTLFGGALWFRSPAGGHGNWTWGEDRTVHALLFPAAPELVTAAAGAPGGRLAVPALLEGRLCLPPEAPDEAALRVGGVVPKRSLGEPFVPFAPTASRTLRRVRPGGGAKPAAK